MLLLVAIAVGWWIARRISASLQALAVGAKQIREFKLDTPIGVHSRVLEVENLASTMSVMQSAIQQFVEISKALSAEKDFDRLLEMILVQARAVCGADCGSICLLSEDERALEFVLVHHKHTSNESQRDQ